MTLAPSLTLPRTAALAAALAAAAYLPALGNRFALDDGAIVERNPAAHSIPAALEAATRPYWPAAHAAGLWRPLVIFSFAADWSLARGNPRWLHAANILWHALATALVVALLWAYLPGAPALAAGLVFAAHPVHVEAVANLVGRAELLAAVFVLSAVLIARTVRERRAAGRSTGVAEVLLLAAVLLGLLSKEHAAVAVALIALDDVALRPGGGLRPALPQRDYGAVVALTVLWLVARRAVEGGLSFEQVAATFFQLDTGGRIATMLPVVLVVLRLLVWPFDLSAEYHPQVVDRLESLTAAGVLGLVMLAACAALAVAAWRRHRAAAVGLCVVGIAWLPTSNFLFPTGIVLAERTLYLPSVGFALVAAALYAAAAAWRGGRAAATLAAVAVLAFAARAATRAPVWRDNRALVVASILAHPESYKVHQSAARVHVQRGDTAAALRAYGVAAELYPLDNYLLTEIGALELEAGRVPRAIRTLRRAAALNGRHAQTHELLAHALLRADSVPAALAAARRAVATGPARAGAARMLAAGWLRAGHPDSAIAVWPDFARRGGRRFERWLYAASTWAALGDAAAARAAFDSALVELPADSVVLAQLREAQQILAAARLR